MRPQFKRNLASALIALTIATALLELAVGGARATYPAQFGAATALVASQSCPSGVAVDSAGTVYWANRCSGQLLKLPKGAAFATVILSGLNGPYGVAVDAAGNVYYDEYYRGTLSRLAPGSSTPQTLVTGLVYPNYLTVDSAGDVYFITGQTCGDKILRFDTVSNALTTILTAPQPHDSNHGFGGLFVDTSGNLYYTTCDYLTINLLASGTSSPSTILNTPTRPSGIAVDKAGNVFYTLYNSSVNELASGSLNPTILSTQGSSRLQLAIDQSGDLYFTDDVGGRIWELPAGSPNQVTVSTTVTSTVTSTLTSTNRTTVIATAVVPPVTVPITSVSVVTSISSNTQTVSVSFTPVTITVTSLTSITQVQTATGSNQLRTETFTTSVMETSTASAKETITQTSVVMQSTAPQPWSSTAIIALIFIIALLVAYVLLSTRRRPKPAVPTVPPAPIPTPPIDQTGLDIVDGIVMKYLGDHEGKISISAACAELGMREPQLRESIKRLIEKGMVSK